MLISDIVTDTLPDTAIPSIAAVLPQTEEAPEIQPLLMSFENYSGKECHIDSMDNKRARKALQVLRDMGVNIHSDLQFAQKLPKLEVKPIRDEGAYRALYKSIRHVTSPEVQLQEAKADADKCRIFFFIIKNVMYLVAISDSHIETDKQRR